MEQDGLTFRRFLADVRNQRGFGLKQASVVLMGVGVTLKSGVTVELIIPAVITGLALFVGYPTWRHVQSRRDREARPRPPDPIV